MELKKKKKQLINLLIGFAHGKSLTIMLPLSNFCQSLPNGNSPFSVSGIKNRQARNNHKFAQVIQGLSHNSTPLRRSDMAGIGGG